METNIIPATPTAPSPKEAHSSLQEVLGSHTEPNGVALPSQDTNPATQATTNAPTSTLAVRIYTDPLTAPIPALAYVNAAACATDPFSLLLNREKHNLPSTLPIPFAKTHAGIIARITTKLSAGAIVVEAGNYAAIACWAPPAVNLAMEVSDGDLSFPEMAGRPLFRGCLRTWAKERRRVLPVGTRYWYVTLMARHPDKPSVKGAVRAVLEVGLKWADEEQVPVWLEAGNERARDVYAAFGFESTSVARFGGEEGKSGVPIWSMVRWPRKDGGA